MKKFSLTVFSVALLAGTTHASFEMLMQIDTMSGGLNASVIKRFDPVTGVYLGAFGLGYLTNPQCLQYKNGILYVLDTVNTTALGGGRIHKFNPNTGEILGTIVLPPSWGKVNFGSQFSMDASGNFYVADGQATNSYVNKYSPTGGYISNGFWPSLGSSQLYGSSFNDAANRLYVGNIATSTIEVYNPTSQAAAIQSLAAPNGPLFMTQANGYLYYIPNFAGSVYRSAIAADGSLGVATAFAGYTGSHGVGFGHSPYGYASTFNGTNWSINRFNGITMDPLGTFGTGLLQNPWSNPVVVVAPEPGSLVALGIAGMLLLRRRK
ncbi:MAG: PEP-CTERM sorting domain-containing protein [Armatimonadetes bacterium]|nr:PEP-CTERM sorting domain-containing protein [Armatimonadota bacterium]